MTDQLAVEKRVTQRFKNFTKISNFENQDCMMWRVRPMMWGRTDHLCGEGLTVDVGDRKMIWERTDHCVGD